jgi:tagatose 1,6-diphosphate aldolase
MRCGRGLETGSVDYMRDLNALTDSAATPWDKHPVFGPGGSAIFTGG